MRRAAGDTTGKTISAQIKKATENLGYPVESWRIREGWYLRGGHWGSAAVDDLRQRFSIWQKRQAAARDGPENGRPALVQRLDAIRAGLAQLTRQIDELEAEIIGLGG